MKKKVSIILALILLVSLLPTISIASQEPVKVTIDGNIVDFDVEPTIVEGRTLVPLRAIFETLGLTVGWNAETKTAIGEKDGTKIELPVGNKYAKKNGQQMELDVPATIIEGRTLVPVRFIAESTGATVDWDATTRTVVIINQVSDGNSSNDDVKNEEIKENANNIQSTPNIQITGVDLHGEIVTIKNDGSESVNLQGYKILSTVGDQSFIFQSYILASGETVKVYSGKATGDIKWSGAYIWNNEGDSAELYDSNGKLVSLCKGI